MIHSRNGYHRRAIDALLELAATTPTAKVYAALAREFREIGDTASAYGSYRRALRANPKDIDALLGLASLHMESGRDDDAIIVYFDILRNHPRIVEAHINLGNLLARAERYDEAEVCYLNAIRLAGKSRVESRVYYNLARLCAVTDRPVGAIDALLCAGVPNPQFAVRACLDDAFVEARELDRFAKVMTLAERPLHQRLTRLLEKSGEEPVRENLRTHPYLRQIVETRDEFNRFRPFLPDR